MLVYVDPARIVAQLDVRRTELGLAGARRLSVYFATTRDGRARVEGYVDDAPAHQDRLGTTTSCEHDITHVLARIGCPDVAGLAAWAARPILLSATDNDLLRYTLGLPLVPASAVKTLRMPALLPRAIDDALATHLLDAVHDDLGSDANRMVLADRLQELGDPRGELIALQLARARTSGEPSPREQELLEWHGRAWLRPVASAFAAYTFRRGFVASATIDERVMLKPIAMDDRIWSTIEELETTNSTLALSPSLRSLRRLATTGIVVRALAEADRSFPKLASIIGTRRHMPQRPCVNTGVAFGPDVALFARTTALDHVRAMSLEIDAHTEAFLRTRLGRRLEHVELFQPDLHGLDAARWRQVFEANPSVTLGLRTSVDGWLVVIVRLTDRMVIQVSSLAGAGTPDWSRVARCARILSAGRPVWLERIGPAMISLEPLVDELRARFARVDVVAAQHWRSP